MKTKTNEHKRTQTSLRIDNPWLIATGGQGLTTLINKVLVGAQLEFEIVLGFRRVAVVGINLCDTLFVGGKNEKAFEGISRDMTPFI